MFDFSVSKAGLFSYFKGLYPYDFLHCLTSFYQRQTGLAVGKKLDSCVCRGQYSSFWVLSRLQGSPLPHAGHFQLDESGRNLNHSSGNLTELVR